MWINHAPQCKTEKRKEKKAMPSKKRKEMKGEICLPSLTLPTSSCTSLLLIYGVVRHNWPPCESIAAMHSACLAVKGNGVDIQTDQNHPWLETRKEQREQAHCDFAVGFVLCWTEWIHNPLIRALGYFLQNCYFSPRLPQRLSLAATASQEKVALETGHIRALSRDALGLVSWRDGYSVLFKYSCIQRQSPYIVVFFLIKERRVTLQNALAAEWNGRRQ